MNNYNLAELWERHLQTEFETKDADATMETMIDDPYVNHIPTLTGGVGKEHLRHFYLTYFIPTIPEDANFELISRTVGENRVVDEMIISFTHDKEMPFMLPNIPASGRFVELPHVVIVTFDEDKIANEHIYWDQASLLVQVGLLDQNLLPVVGVEAAQKIRDKTLPSNGLFEKNGKLW